MALREDQTLKLYTAGNGHVWYADGARSPLSSGLPVSEFLAKLQPRASLYVRVLGMAQNAQLLVGLCPLASSEKLGRLEIAGPTVCETEEERRDPAMSLFRMRQCLLGPSLGGWHVATLGDYAAYKLVDRWAAGNVGSDALPLVYQHPAWQDLSFICGIDPLLCGTVLATLIDPRWYVDPAHPERLARAEQFMGLGSRTFAEMQREHAGKHHLRCQAVLDAWRSVPPRVADQERPGYFLWRLAEGGRELQASRAFLYFLIRSWNQRLCDLSPGKYKQEVFVPDHHFEPWESQAYRLHASKDC